MKAIRPPNGPIRPPIDQLDWKTQIVKKKIWTENVATQKLKLWSNSKTQIVTKLKKSNCDKTQKLKLWL